MNYDNIKTKPTENSEVEITGEIPVSAIPEYRKKALKGINETLTIPGFRKGHIPEKVVVDRVGEVYILEEAAEIALKDIAPEIIEKNAPQYIGRPRIALTKLAPGNPIEFKITVDVIPEIKLPDYKKIAQAEMEKKAEKVEVTDKEVNDVIEEVRKQRAHHAYHLAHKDDTEHSHADEEIEKHKPEFTDEFVKTVGDFKDVEDFKTKARENIMKEKEQRAKDKKRGEIFEKLITATSVKLPQSIIENELQRMFAQFEADVRNVGLKVEDYIKHIGKTIEDLRKDWLPDAEKRAKLNIVLERIAQAEKITADKDQVDKEVEMLTKHYKDIDAVQARLYAEHMYTIEKVITFLEAQK
jgi:FKBP-type peptidyl-prolyl cis-trans isomerase (trigger factor)